VDCDVSDAVLILYSEFVKYLRKNMEYKEAVHQLFIDFKEAYDAVRREVFYVIFIDFGMPKNLGRFK
jgi:hypothetical protein